MDIVFCKTRADPEFYRSYTDFWSLVELAGFPWMWLDELEPGRDAVYIVTPRNGELPPILPRLQGDRACKFVWWCLERPDERGSVTRGKALEPGVDELWLSDRWLTNLHNQRGWGPVRFVPVGSHERLNRGPYARMGPRWDWTHLSYTNPRRKAIYEQIGGKVLPNCWGEERHEGLGWTGLMVNVHQDDWLVIEPLRFALAAAYAIPIISEWVHDPWPYMPGAQMVMSHCAKLPLMVNEMIQIKDSAAKGQWKYMGHSARVLMTRNFEFGKCVREAVACLG